MREKFFLIILLLFLTACARVETVNPFINNQKTMQNLKVREAAVAGSWYPADSEKLKEEIKGYLDQVPELNITKKPRMIIVPHPGLAFGGPTQVYAYQSVANFKYRNIFLITVSHYEYFDGISIGDYDFFETPLGKIKVNRDIVSFLKYKNEKFQFIEEAQAQEHSIEMQLPFLQYIFGEKFQIVPIVLSGEGDENAKILAEYLYQAITPDDLVVISSDLSHYPAYNEANKADKETLEGILTLDVNKFAETLKKLAEDPPANTSTFACGEKGIKAGLILAEKLNLKEAKLLHYENSGDRPIGEKDQVVGYGAIAVLSSDEESFFETVVLTKKEKEKALEIARKTLENHFAEKEYVMEDIAKDSVLNKPLGAFVTLTMGKGLRGCIGNFEPEEPLFKIIQKMAMEAAFDDPRFPALTEEEFKIVDIEISVLSPRKKINSYEEIIPGKHGVFVQKGFGGGTYLPQVAPEQGWDREEMMNSLCAHKSGIEEEAWKDGSAEMWTYTAEVVKEGIY